ncbi:hypothetical protein M378DRAFT_583840 [Amanita muscaria Koide BX008]|uniref:Uncharacterized protein n=1 Tax=Amanita muscaria (strain Koide BX008) TaxID=946122 RepID=A0A0C2RZ09_AMAMK|nr:hypothetical protein M378DRAFT_583840 [Amanita muscaria Koide BX008]
MELIDLLSVSDKPMKPLLFTQSPRNRASNGFRTCLRYLVGYVRQLVFTTMRLWKAGGSVLRRNIGAATRSR